MKTNCPFYWLCVPLIVAIQIALCSGESKLQCPFTLTDAPKYCHLSADCLKTTCVKYGNVFSILANCTSNNFDVSLNKQTVPIRVGDNIALKETFFDLIIDYQPEEDHHRFTIYRAMKWCSNRHCQKKLYEKRIRSSVKSICQVIQFLLETNSSLLGMVPQDQYGVSYLAWRLENKNFSLSSLLKSANSSDAPMQAVIFEKISGLNGSYNRLDLHLTDHFRSSSDVTNSQTSYYTLISRLFVWAAFFLMILLSLVVATLFLRQSLKKLVGRGVRRRELQPFIRLSPTAKKAYWNRMP